MMNKTLLCAALATIAIAGTALAKSGTAQGPNPDTKDAVKVLREAAAARGAIARGERTAALDIVNDALALEHTLAKGHRYASIGTEQGTLETITNDHGAPLVEEYDHIAESGTIDLRAVRRDLLLARADLRAHESSAADRALSRIDRTIDVHSKVSEDDTMRAQENLSLSKRELRDGNLVGAKAEAAAAVRDMGTPPAAKK